MFRVNDNSISGTSVQEPARSGRQQVTMFRHQSAGVCSNRSSCSIRSKHREVVWDTGEDAALQLAPKVFGRLHRSAGTRDSLDFAERISYTAMKGICKASSCAVGSPMSAGRKI